MTISFVRACSAAMSSPFFKLTLQEFLGAASFTIYTRTKEYCHSRNLFIGDNIFDVSAAGGLGCVLQ